MAGLGSPVQAIYYPCSDTPSLVRTELSQVHSLALSNPDVRGLGMVSIRGRIVSFDPVLRVGIIQPEASTQGVVFVESNVVNTRAPLHTMIGRAVLFDIIHTDQGTAAVNVHITRRLFLKPGNLLGALVAPLLVGFTTYGLVNHLRWPHLHSYIVSVNFVSFLFVMVLSRAPFSYKLQAADLMAITLAVAGGAIGIFIAALFLPTRFRTDSARFWLVVLIILQGFALHHLDPQILSSRTWRPLLTAER